jgi:hypothetical protein
MVAGIGGEYTGGNYAAQSAPQMTAIMNMVNKITSGY